MTAHLGLVVARAHGVLAVRPGSPVFHVYTGPRSRRTGRFPRGARPVGNCRVGRLHELERVGSTLDLGGRRLCGRCAARLSSTSRRAAQPFTREEFARTYATVGLGDLLVAAAMCITVEENRRVAYVASVVHGHMNPTAARRPARFGKPQARYDLEVELLRQRRDLAAAERTPEEIEADRLARAAEAEDARRRLVEHRKGDQLARARDRRDRGKWLMPHERELLANA